MAVNAVLSGASRIEEVGISFERNGHYFRAMEAHADPAEVAASLNAPLSVIYQVTRRCNFDCSFCSETDQMPDPTLEEIRLMRDNLRGVARVFLSGGEPLLRRDLPEIVELFEDCIVAIPTNATPAREVARKLVGRVAFVNVGLEGPRTTTTRVRGDYDKIMAGIEVFRNVGLPLSLSAVVLRSTLPALPFTFQIADVLQAGKLKLIHPIRKGNGLNLPDEEFLGLDESDALFSNLSRLKEEHGWKPALRMTTWTKETEGYSILVYPNGTTWAWPVFGGVAAREHQGGPEEKVLFLGNVLEEPIAEIWRRYPFKVNHLRKYLGHSIRVSERAA